MRPGSGRSASSSSGCREPISVGVCEVVVAAGAAFDAGVDGGPDPEVLGHAREGDVRGPPQRPSVGDVRDGDRGGEVAEHLAGDGPLEETDDLLLRSAGRTLPGHVLACAGVAGHADEGCAVEGRVGGAVTASGEAVAGGLAAGGRGWGDAAESGEGCLGAEAVGIASGGDQELGRGVVTDAGGGSQARVVGAGHAVECGRELVVVRR